MTKEGSNKKKETEMRKVLAKSKIAKKEAAQSSKKPVSAAAAAAAATAKRRAIRAKQASAQQQKEQRANAAVKKNPNRRADAATAAKADTSGSDLEPPFSYEIHHKNKTISVFVTLHKVPPATIDVESTTPSTLIVHTDKFTKKWRLVFPFPEGLVVENEKADYTYEGGVLKCVFPIKGNIPSTIVQQREKLFESFRSQKNLRFRTTQEGALVVRSRRATMSTAETGSKEAGKKAAGGEAPTNSKNEGSSSATATAVAAPKDSLTGNKKPAAAAATAAAGKKPTTATPSTAKISIPAAKEPTTNAPSQPKSAKKAPVADGLAMIQLAAEAGKASRNKFAERLKKEKELLKRRQEALGKKTMKQTTKKERDQSAFERIVAEQKAQLQAQIRLAAKPTRQPQAKNAGKTVKFQSA